MIRVLIYEAYPQEMYGNQMYISWLFQFIDKSHFMPFLVTPIHGRLNNAIIKMGGKCEVIPPSNRLVKYGGRLLNKNPLHNIVTLFYLLKYNLELIKFIKKENIDVIQCNSLRSLLNVGFAAKLAGKPCVWYIKGEHSNTILDRMGFFLADKVLFLHRNLRDTKYPKLIKKYKSKIDILKIGINLSRIEEIMQNNGCEEIQDIFIEKKSINIIYVGYLSPLKGIDFLVEAMRSVNIRYPNITLFLVGDCVNDEHLTFKEKLLKLITSINLNDKVVFTGWRNDVLEIISRMDLFVLPSLTEGTPHSIMEAMAFGKPVIATKVGGIPELIIDGDTGLLVEAKSTMAIENAIMKLISDKRLRGKIGNNAKEAARKNFSILKNIKSLEQIYTDIVAR